MNCFCPGRPDMNERNIENMEHKRQLTKDALDGLGGVKSSSRVRSDLMMNDSLKVRRENEME